MTSDDKDKKPDLPHLLANTGQHNCHGGRHQHQNWWINAAGGSSNKAVGNTAGLEKDIFDKGRA